MSNLLIDFDKAGAEWVVVAYLAADERMLEVVKSGESPHVATGHLITGAPKDLIILEDKILDKATDPDELYRVRNSTPELRPLLDLPFIPRSMTIRQGGKKSNHGLNYGMKYKRFALENEIPEAEAADIVDLYTTVAYVGIPKWWEYTRNELKNSRRTLTNCFGRKIRLRGEWGEKLFDKAYSFVPQSTVGDTVNRAIRGAYEDDSYVFSKADLLLQRHDSATFQYPTENITDLADFIRKFAYGYMNPELEYNGTKFRIGTDAKVGFDLGHLTKLKLSDDLSTLRASLEETLTRLQAKTAEGDTADQTEPEPDPEWEVVREEEEVLVA